jgi:hypothetical protein
MYSGLPAGHRRAIKTALTASWFASAGAGLSAFVLSPNVIVHELGALGTVLAGIALAVSACVAALGIALGRYRWEWVSAWVSAASLAPYLLVLWAFIIVGASDNSTQAFLATSLLGFYISRALECAAHAAKLRAAHTASTAVIDSMTDEGEHDGDGRTGSE